MAWSGEWNGETSFCKCSSIHPLQYFITVFAYDVSLIAQDEQQAARCFRRHSQLLLVHNPVARQDRVGKIRIKESKAGNAIESPQTFFIWLWVTGIALEGTADVNKNLEVDTSIHLLTTSIYSDRPPTKCANLTTTWSNMCPTNKTRIQDVKEDI